MLNLFSAKTQNCASTLTLSAVSLVFAFTNFSYAMDDDQAKRCHISRLPRDPLLLVLANATPATEVCLGTFSQTHPNLCYPRIFDYTLKYTCRSWNTLIEEETAKNFNALFTEKPLYMSWGDRSFRANSCLVTSWLLDDDNPNSIDKTELSCFNKMIFTLQNKYYLNIDQEKGMDTITIYGNIHAFSPKDNAPREPINAPIKICLEKISTAPKRNPSPMMIELKSALNNSRWSFLRKDNEEAYRRFFSIDIPTDDSFSSPPHYQTTFCPTQVMTVEMFNLTPQALQLAQQREESEHSEEWSD